MKSSMVEATHPVAEKIQKYYSWRASNYDAGASFEIEHHAEALRMADIQEGQHILDVGCGTGRGTVGLAQGVGPSGRVDALDLTEAMLEQARKPGGKLVLVNMSKPDERKTFYERIYEKGWAIMPCRPVLMSSYLPSAGFTDIQRVYRPTRGSIIARLWGQEIVLARKSLYGVKILSGAGNLIWYTGG